MRRVLLAVTAALASLVALWLARPPEPAIAERQPQRTRPGPQAPPAPSERLDRDPFAFGPTRTPAPEPPETPAELPVELAAPAAPEPPPPLHLTGLVVRDGRLHAALSRDGEVLLAAVGDSAFGWTLVELDAGAGALLRGADGALLRLRAER